MSLFQRLITETQISNPPEPAMDHDLIKLMVLLPAIAIYFRSFRYETPCSSQTEKTTFTYSDVLNKRGLTVYYDTFGNFLFA